MKLTKEQVEGLKRSKQEAFARADYDAADAINRAIAACEVEEVDPVANSQQTVRVNIVGVGASGQHGYRYVYIDAVKGDDANDGKTPDKAVRTIERASELTQAPKPDPVEEEAERFLREKYPEIGVSGHTTKRYAAFHRHMLAKDQLANDDAAPTDSDLIHERPLMKLTREQVWQEAVKYASENSDDGIVSLMVGFHARMNAACEVEEVDPVVEEAMRWFARPETGSIPKRFDDMVRSLAAFHRHMLAKHRPAFDEGRAREIVLRLSQRNRMLGSSKASSDFFEMLAREAIKEYTCGSSGSSSGCGNVFINAGEKSPNHFVFEDGGRGAGKSEPRAESPAGVSAAPANRAGGADDDDLRTKGRRLIQSMYRDGVISDAAMHTLIRLFVSPPSDAKGFAFIDTKDDNHEEDDRCEECSCGRGAGSSGTGSSPDALTPQPRESKQSSGTSAPAADAGCERWLTAMEFFRMAGIRDTPNLIADRDAAWVKRFTEGDLSERAFNTKPDMTSGIDWYLGVRAAFAFIRQQLERTPR